MPDHGGAGPAGGGLVVRGPAGSRVVVATDRMRAQLERCAALVAAADAARGQLAAARFAGAASSAAEEAALERAERLLLRARLLAERLHDSVALAAQGYDAAEQALGAGQRALAGLLAGILGQALRMAAGPALLALLGNPPLLAYTVAMLAAGRLRGGEGGAGPGLLGWLVENPQLITSPEFVRAVGLVATSGDDAFLGFLGLPPGLSLVLGEDALGLTGTPFGASLVIGAAGLAGALRETEVRVWRAPPSAGPPGAPGGSAERLARVPDGDAQLRVERYDAPGLPPRWIVYVSPTVDFAVTGSEPFDMTSNMHGVAGGSPASLRAIELALADAGVAPGEEVQFVGFSQGGLIAARAVESGLWSAVGLETHGAPVGGVEIPPGVGGLTVRHTDDLVPAAAGPDAADGLVHVERRAFLPGEPMPALPAPAHQRESYLATARLIDSAESGLLRAERDRLTAFGADYLAAGGTVQVFEYRAERAPSGGSSS